MFRLLFDKRRLGVDSTLFSVFQVYLGARGLSQALAFSLPSTLSFLLRALDFILSRWRGVRGVDIDADWDLIARAPNRLGDGFSNLTQALILRSERGEDRKRRARNFASAL